MGFGAAFIALSAAGLRGSGARPPAGTELAMEVAVYDQFRLTPEQVQSAIEHSKRELRRAGVTSDIHVESEHVPYERRTSYYLWGTV